mmetsp:Transcript_27614/g.78110  ORF Transcript_27614/g.78110 Transcript_27614/m.78110 type:complete len:325 (+) Transcript_27614:465-1439(+)
MHLTRAANLGKILPEGFIDFGNQALELRQPLAFELLNPGRLSVHFSPMRLRLLFEVLDLQLPFLELLEDSRIGADNGVRLGSQLINLRQEGLHVLGQLRHLCLELLFLNRVLRQRCLLLSMLPGVSGSLFCNIQLAPEAFHHCPQSLNFLLSLDVPVLQGTEDNLRLHSRQLGHAQLLGCVCEAPRPVGKPDHPLLQRAILHLQLLGEARLLQHWVSLRHYGLQVLLFSLQIQAEFPELILSPLSVLLDLLQLPHKSGVLLLSLVLLSLLRGNILLDVLNLSLKLNCALLQRLLLSPRGSRGEQPRVRDANHLLAHCVPVVARH